MCDCFCCYFSIRCFCFWLLLVVCVCCCCCCLSMLLLFLLLDVVSHNISPTLSSPRQAHKIPRYTLVSVFLRVNAYCVTTHMGSNSSSITITRRRFQCLGESKLYEKYCVTQGENTCCPSVEKQYHTVVRTVMCMSIVVFCILEACFRALVSFWSGFDQMVRFA